MFELLHDKLTLLFNFEDSEVLNTVREKVEGLSQWFNYEDIKDLSPDQLKSLLDNDETLPFLIKYLVNTDQPKTLLLKYQDELFYLYRWSITTEESFESNQGRKLLDAKLLIPDLLFIIQQKTHSASELLSNPAYLQKVLEIKDQYQLNFELFYTLNRAQTEELLLIETSEEDKIQRFLGKIITSHESATKLINAFLIETQTEAIRELVDIANHTSISLLKYQICKLNFSPAVTNQLSNHLDAFLKFNLAAQKFFSIRDDYPQDRKRVARAAELEAIIYQNYQRFCFNVLNRQLFLTNDNWIKSYSLLRTQLKTERNNIRIDHRNEGNTFTRFFSKTSMLVNLIDKAITAADDMIEPSLRNSIHDIFPEEIARASTSRIKF